MREGDGFSQTQVTKNMGYSHVRYSDYENEIRTTQNEDLIILANYYDVATYYLLGTEWELTQDEKLIELMTKAEKNHGLKLVFDKTADSGDKQLEQLSKMIDIIKDEE